MTKENHKKGPLGKLAVVYPELAETIIAGLQQKSVSTEAESTILMVEETLWAVSQEISFGHSVAMGYMDLMGAEDKEKVWQYKDLVRKFGNRGPSLGRIMATYLIPVLKLGDRKLLERFIDVANIMINKGTYTLARPLQLLPVLLRDKDLGAVFAYLDLLGETFSKNLSYVQCQNFAYILPRAIAAFPSARQTWQIEILTDIIQADFRVAEPFLEGLQKGLNLLSKDALKRYVGIGLDKLKQNRQMAAKFLSLESKLGIDTFTDMQITVPISQVQHQLSRYLRARTGMMISVLPMSSLPKVYVNKQGMESLVCSDGKTIYLPSEIELFSHKTENATLYKCLVKLEAGYHEFNTFEFDLERVIERCQGNAQLNNARFKGRLIQNLKSAFQNQKDLSDLECFFSSFPQKDLASDLFIIFEHGRIRQMSMSQYPGLMRQVMSMLQWEIDRMNNRDEPLGSIFQLYLLIALEIPEQRNANIKSNIKKHMASLAQRFEKKMHEDCTVESCAELVTTIYPDIAEMLKQSEDVKNPAEDYIPLQIPFGRKMQPDLFFSAHKKYDNLADKLKTSIEAKGYKIYKSDIKKHLVQNNGSISHQDLTDMIRLTHKNNGAYSLNGQNISTDLSRLDLSKLFGESGIPRVEIQDFAGPVFWHQEWSDSLQDYLQNHVRVLDQMIPCYSGDFYDFTLQRHRGLIKKIRYAFELLKPEGLIRLRQWIEGDEFDYRAMLDFVVDKKAGKIPSERLYIKRIKQLRDVSVLLLVDLSRSTANPVVGSQATVMDVEKEAIVLFCEALEVVGDAFAIAGFSGTGRLGVDYFRVKEFDEKMNDTIKQRINALAPRRSTRMGAAIRHATLQLQDLSSKIRLLIVLSDGFPNDVDYKRNYAVADTRKAISETRAKNIFTHAITINIAGDSRLDDLYGNVHHNIISDVRELPDKLLRIYSNLTRS